MYAVDPEKLVLEPKTIDGTLYVPYHTEVDETIISTFLEYEKVLKLNGLTEIDEGGFDTDDFRYDP